LLLVLFQQLDLQRKLIQPLRRHHVMPRTFRLQRMVQTWAAMQRRLAGGDKHHFLTRFGGFIFDS
jgi:hypothetical protein